MGDVTDKVKFENWLLYGHTRPESWLTHVKALHLDCKKAEARCRELESKSRTLEKVLYERVEKAEARLKLVGEESLHHNGRLITENQALEERCKELEASLNKATGSLARDLNRRAEKVESEARHLEREWRATQEQRETAFARADKAEAELADARFDADHAHRDWEIATEALKEVKAELARVTAEAAAMRRSLVHITDIAGPQRSHVPIWLSQAREALSSTSAGAGLLDALKAER